MAHLSTLAISQTEAVALISSTLQSNKPTQLLVVI